MRIVWREEIENLRKYIKSGKSYSQIAEIYGVTKQAVQSAVSRLEQQGLIESREEMLFGSPIVKVPEQRQQKLTIRFPDKKIPKFNYRNFLQKAIEIQRMLSEKSENQKEATVEILSNRPIAVGFSSDWHMGAKGVDYNAFLRHTDIFLNTPNLFMAAVGDYGNFFVKSKMKSAMFGELFGPQEQKDVLEGVFKELGKKVIARTTGNHDDFVKDEVGIDIAESFFAGCSEAPYLREGGGINLKLGTENPVTYRIYLKHKYRFHSSLNPTNSHKRMHDLESPYDIGVLGHRHIPEVLHTDRWSGGVKKEIICLLTGTYKVDDTWARAQGFGQSSNIGVPTVILFPGEKRMIPFKYLEDAVMVMDLIDELWEKDREKLDYILNKHVKMT